MKKARPKGAKAAREIALLDQAVDCRQNLMTLSELLRSYADAEGIQPDVLANAGKMIASETQKLYELLERLSRRLPVAKRSD